MPSSKRQRELARRRMERQAQRRAEAAATRRRRARFAVLGSVGAVLLIVAGVYAIPKLRDDDKTGDNPNDTAALGKCAATSFRPETEQSGGKTPGVPAAKDWGSTKTVPATLTLSQGTVQMELFAEKAPCTVASFQHLTAKNYFDSTVCHRLTTEGIFVLQCGDPTGTGSGGPGYSIPEENLEGATYPAGTVAMARTQAPHSGGSQFFLVYKDSTTLPPDYTPFGRITSGLDILEKIAAKGTDTGQGDGKPKEAVTIKEFTVAA